jgi:tetratricopeptide (TPR) repeat protein
VLLAPVSGLAQAGPQLVAERYSYLACLPFALLAAAGLAPLARRWPRATCAAGAGAVPRAGGAHERAGAPCGTTRPSLWTHTFAVAPAEPHARIHLARLREAEAQRGRIGTRAIGLDEEALGLLAGAGEHPSLPQIEIDQGVLLEHLSELVPERRVELLAQSLLHAERGLEQARVLARFDPLWNHARAVTLFKLGRLEEALPDLSLAARARAGERRVRRSLALVLTRLGRFDEALPELRAAAGARAARRRARAAPGARPAGARARGRGPRANTGACCSWSSRAPRFRRWSSRRRAPR